MIKAERPKGEAEFSFFTSDEKLYWERYVYSISYDSGGEPVNAVIIIEDTTKEHGMTE